MPRGPQTPRSRRRNIVHSELSEPENGGSESSEDIGELALPPELLLGAMDFLLPSSKGTLLEFMLCSHSCYALGLPLLLRKLVLPGDGKDASWIVNLAECGVPDSADGADKFRHVRSIRATVGIRDPAEGGLGRRASPRRTTDPAVNAAKLDILRRCARHLNSASLFVLGSVGHGLQDILPQMDRLSSLDLAFANMACLPNQPLSLPVTLTRVSLRSYAPLPSVDLQEDPNGPLLDSLSALPNLEAWSCSLDLLPSSLKTRPTILSKLGRLKAFRESALRSLLQDPAFLPHAVVIRRGYIPEGGWAETWKLLRGLSSLRFLHIPIYQQHDSGIPLSSGFPPNLVRLVVELAGVKPEPKRIAKNVKELTSALKRLPDTVVLIAKDVGEFTDLERKEWSSVGKNVRLCGPGDGEYLRADTEDGWKELDECVFGV